jgi:hypothetical protein
VSEPTVSAASILADTIVRTVELGVTICCAALKVPMSAAAGMPMLAA